MQTLNKHRGTRGFAALAAAVAAVSYASSAHAQTTFSTNAFEAVQIEGGDAFIDDSGQFLQLRGAANEFHDFGIMDFSGASLGIPVGQEVSQVNSLALNMVEDNFEEPPTNESLGVYLATDTNPAEAQNGSTLLSWEPNSTFTGGLNAPGQTGSFAAGTQLFQIGTGTYTTQVGSPNNPDIPATFSISLNSTEASYVASQINTGNTIRLVLTTGETDGGLSSFIGYTNTGSAPDAPPSISVGVTTTAAVSNTSLLYAGAYSAANTAKSLNVDVGKLIDIGGTPTYCVLAGATTTTQVPISNGSTVPTDSLVYTVTGNGASGTSTNPGPDPIAPGTTSTITVGFSGSDTSAASGGNPATGSVTVNNLSNYKTDTPVTINLNDGVPSLALTERFVDGGSTVNGQQIGKILVGTTGSAPVTITTVNPVGLTDYSDDALTTLTLNANQTSTAFTQDDVFTGKAVATLAATSGSTPVTFDGTESATVTGQVQVAISGMYGDDTPVTEGNTTQNYTADFTSFPQSAITGMGLQGENDSSAIRVYEQWAGYQAAAVTGNTTTTLGVGGTATVSNAASSDNLYTPNGSETTYNNGLRATAWVTGATFNQSFWGQTGLTPSSNGSGTTLVGGGSSASATLSFNPAGAINGTYGATLSVDLENEQDIQGTAVNDVAPVVFNLTNTVTSNPSIESGAYTLNGGTLSAPATHLTGSFTQTGGSSVFAGISGTGTVAVSGGSLQLAASSGLTTLSSLSVSGNGVFDIANNHVIINYGSGPDPIGSIGALIAAGYNGGSWNGAGITSSTAAVTPGYGVGYADSADAGNPANLSSGTIELKYTLLGDANLDGVVNGIDFGILAANFNKGVTGWDKGDFNYDNVVNGIDFGELAANFNKGATGASVGGPAWTDPALLAFAAENGLLADVPEPASLGLLAVGAAGLMARRRNRR